jgi:hypothetical protein
MKVPAGQFRGGEGALAPYPLNQPSQISVTDRSLAGAVLAVAGAFRAKARGDDFFADIIARLPTADVAELKMDAVEDPRSAHFISGL